LQELSAEPLRNILLALVDEDLSLIEKIFAKRELLQAQTKQEKKKCEFIYRLHLDVVSLEQEWNRVNLANFESGELTLEPVAEVVWLNIVKVCEYQKNGYCEQALELLNQLTNFYVSDYAPIMKGNVPGQIAISDTSSLLPSILGEIEDKWKELWNMAKHDQHIKATHGKRFNDNLKMWSSMLDNQHFNVILDIELE